MRFSDVEGDFGGFWQRSRVSADPMMDSKLILTAVMNNWMERHWSLLGTWGCDPASLEHGQLLTN